MTILHETVSIVRRHHCIRSAKRLWIVSALVLHGPCRGARHCVRDPLISKTTSLGSPMRRLNTTLIYRSNLMHNLNPFLRRFLRKSLLFIYWYVSLELFLWLLLSQFIQSCLCECFVWRLVYALLFRAYGVLTVELMSFVPEWFLGLLYKLSYFRVGYKVFWLILCHWSLSHPTSTVIDAIVRLLDFSISGISRISEWMLIRNICNYLLIQTRVISVMRRYLWNLGSFSLAYGSWLMGSGCLRVRNQLCVWLRSL